MFSASGEPPISMPHSMNMLSASHGILAADNQMPEKSGLPSGCFGAGAFMFGLPSAVRGTFGVGYLSHCACDARGADSRATATDTAIAAFTALPSRHPNGPRGAEPGDFIEIDDHRHALLLGIA